MAKKQHNPTLCRARGERVAVLQRAAQLSDTALAEKARCGASTIRNARNSRFLRTDSLMAIAEALRVSLDDVANRTETAPYRNRKAAAAPPARPKDEQPLPALDATVAVSPPGPAQPPPGRQSVMLPPAAKAPPTAVVQGRRALYQAALFCVLALLLAGAPFAKRALAPGDAPATIWVASLVTDKPDRCAAYGVVCGRGPQVGLEDRGPEHTGTVAPRADPAPSPTTAPQAPPALPPAPNTIATVQPEACVSHDIVQVELKIDDTTIPLPTLVPCEWKTKIPFMQTWAKTKGMCLAGAERIKVHNVPQVTVRTPPRCRPPRFVAGEKAASGELRLSARRISA